jgi:hypothetical protein
MRSLCGPAAPVQWKYTYLSYLFNVQTESIRLNTRVGVNLFHI